MKGLRHGRFGSAASVVAVLVSTLAVTPSAAGPNDTTDLAGMYSHIVTGPIAGATGPFSTVYFLSNATSASINVVVKCYNDVTQRVGPPAGTTVNLQAFDVDAVTPVTLGLTTDPLFTGQGWCYFAETSPGVNDFSVAIGMGVQGVAGGGSVTGATHPIFTSNASLAIGMSTAQASVSNDDGNVPIWHGSNWRTFMILLNPTTANVGTVNVDVYGASGNLLGTANTALSARDMDVVVLSNFGARGNADLGQPILSATRGYMGWIFGVNDTSLEAFFYDIPLDKDDVSVLAALDRP
jgi:hypothetical protein